MRPSVGFYVGLESECVRACARVFACVCVRERERERECARECVSEIERGKEKFLFKIRLLKR